MDFLFKVWGSNRQNKAFLVLEDGTDLYVRLILKASDVLQVDGSKLVLESDGTIVDDERVLKMLTREPFLLLTKNEVWQPVHEKPVTSLSMCSTETVISSPTTSVLSESPQNSSNDELGAGSESRVSQSTWEEFDIPLNQVNRSVTEDCEAGNRNVDSINKLVTVTVDAVREIKKYVSTKTFKILAKKIVNKYPKQFQDIDEDGVIIGCCTLTSKLIDRNNYLNRPHKRPANSIQNDVPPAKRKSMLRAKAGCFNWQPDVVVEEPETLKDKKKYLNDNIRKNVSLNEDMVKNLHDTYAIQRLFLNSNPKVEEIETEWPVLLFKEVVYWHFEKLMALTISDLKTMFIQREGKILQLGIESKFTTVETIPSEENEKHEKCLQIIADYFKEDIQMFLMRMDEDEEVQPRINSPWYYH